MVCIRISSIFEKTKKNIDVTVYFNFDVNLLLKKIRVIEIIYELRVYEKTIVNYFIIKKLPLQ